MTEYINGRPAGPLKRLIYALCDRVNAGDECDPLVCLIWGLFALLLPVIGLLFILRALWLSVAPRHLREYRRGVEHARGLR